MTREIKFRVWEPGTKIMFVPNSLPNPTASPDHTGSYTMQFTGLLDKNGHEIYEGDIVDYYGQHIQVIFMDKYGAFGLCGLEKWDCGYLPQMMGEIEVIGNIYENLELLKREQGK